MTVQELRETLTKLVELLQASDAKAATTRGLTEFVESTAEFGELSLNAFVKLAEAGRTPPTPKPGPRPRASAKSVVDPEVLAAEVKSLYERVADPSVTEGQIREVCGRLGSLAKDALVGVAEGVGLGGMKAKKKNDIASEIANRILDRKGAAIRRQLIDRPSSAGTPAVNG